MKNSRRSLPQTGPPFLYSLGTKGNIMRRLVVLALLVLSAAPALNADHLIHLEDYPVRVQVYQRQVHRHYYRRHFTYVSGTGHGNVFEGGQARGIDFAYDCDRAFMDSAGPESYPAAWKKPGGVLTILVGKMGNPDAAWKCDLKVLLKEFAYQPNGRRLNIVPLADYKAWMVRHNYDPEHGKDIPLPKGAYPPADEQAPAPPQ